MTPAPVRTVVLVALFSAKVRDYDARLDEVEARLAARGTEVVARFVQRRGVSDGGVRLMDRPLSRRYVIRPGKLAAVAQCCAARDVDAVVFHNDLTTYQRRNLAIRLGRPVLTTADLI